MAAIASFNYPERRYIQSTPLPPLVELFKADTSSQLKLLRGKVAESIQRGFGEDLHVDRLLAIAEYLVGDLLMPRYPACIWEGHLTDGNAVVPVVRLAYPKTRAFPKALHETPTADFCLTLELTHITAENKQMEDLQSDDGVVGDVDLIQVVSPDQCIFSASAIQGLVNKLLTLRNNHREGADFCEHSDRYVVYLPATSQGYIQITLRTIAEIGIFETSQRR